MEPLQALIAGVRDGPKYRDIGEDIVRRVGERELARCRTLKEAEKATRNTLHQIAGAFADRRVRGDEWLAALQTARQTGDETVFQDACALILQNHASTRERLPLLPIFYATLFAGLPPVRSVLDLACGLNPLTRLWMPLAPDATYWACDLYHSQADFLNRFFPLCGMTGRAEVRDIAAPCEHPPADVALLLKILPPLEQTDKAAPLRLLRTLNAPTIIVSFPTRTLGGRDVRMAQNYEARFRALLEREEWAQSRILERFAFPGELCFRLTQ